MSRDDAPVTVLLADLRAGRREAFDDLFPKVYDELRRLARSQMRGGAGQTLNATGLVHEAYAKLANYGHMEWQSRAHFFGVAAQAMRRILVSQARRKNAAKRGGDAVRVTLHETYHEVGDASSSEAWADDLAALDDALVALEALNERHARVVECRFFAGLSIEETAEVLGVSPVTVTRDWRMARAWLKDTLGQG